MKKMINRAHVEGRLVECNLEVKVSKAGVTYIGGRMDVATDDAGLNVVPVEVTYAPKHYKNGNENKTFAALYPLAVQKDAQGNVVKASSAITIMGNPGQEPTMVRLDPSIELNEWYKDENGVDTLVSTKRLSGGFAHVVPSINADEAARNKFECDMVITGTQFIEANEDFGTEEKLIIKGATFNFANKILPVEFSVTNPNGIKYFENLDATQNTPVFTKVWGKIVNETVVTKVTEESAFGEPVVRETKKTKRDWVITGTATVAYDFDTEGMLTAQELQEAIANRNIELSQKLADQKAREAAKANNNNAFTAAPTAAPTAGNFAF